MPIVSTIVKLPSKNKLDFPKLMVHIPSGEIWLVISRYLGISVGFVGGGETKNLGKGVFCNSLTPDTTSSEWEDYNDAVTLQNLKPLI